MTSLCGRGMASWFSREAVVLRSCVGATWWSWHAARTTTSKACSPGLAHWFQEQYVTDQGDYGNRQDPCATGDPDVNVMVCHDVLNELSTQERRDNEVECYTFCGQ